MQKFLMLMGCLGLGFAGSAAEARNADTHVQLIAIHDAYVPSGFLSTSDTFVVANGMFPNSCYKYDHAEVTDVTPMIHEVRVFVDVTPGLCLMVMVPFHQEVEIGHLAAGVHTLRFISGDGTYMEKQLNVQ